MPITLPTPPKSWSALLQCLAAGAPEQANLALLEASLRLLAAGGGSAAHALLGRLTEGELAISPASRCRPRLLRLLPLLSHLLELPCPALPDLPGLDQGLRLYGEALEADSWSLLLRDHQTTPPPLSPQWSPVPASFLQSWLQRGHGRLNRIRAEHQHWPQAADLLSDNWRVMQQLCRGGQWEETAALFQLHTELCAALQHTRSDTISQAIWQLQLGVLLHQDKQQAACALLHEAVQEAPNMLEIFCGNPASARLIIAGAMRNAFPLDPALAFDAITQALAQRQQQPPAAPGTDAWRLFLDAWSQEFFARPENDDSYLQDYFPRQAALRHLGSPPASATELEAVEKKLGCVLPPSYRNFLLTSNGWLLPGSLDQLLPAMELAWLAEPDWLEDCPGDEAVSDAAYFQYGEHQDSHHFRGSYLRRALALSNGDTELLLLVPAVVDRRGEWEAWILDLRPLKARRFRDFFTLMEALRQSVK